MPQLRPGAANKYSKNKQEQKKNFNGEANMYKMENNSNMKNCTKIRLFASPSLISETGLGELSLV